MDPHHTLTAGSCLAVLFFTGCFIQGNDVTTLGIVTPGKEFSVVVLDCVVNFRGGKRTGQSHIPFCIRCHKAAVVGQLAGFIRDGGPV